MKMNLTWNIVKIINKVHLVLIRISTKVSIQHKIGKDNIINSSSNNNRSNRIRMDLDLDKSKKDELVAILIKTMIKEEEIH